MASDTSPPVSIVSGAPYRVRSINGQPPNLEVPLDEPVVVVVESADDSFTVYGLATFDDDHLLIYEKTDRGFGKDVRTWILGSAPIGYTLTARAVF